MKIHISKSTGVVSIDGIARAVDLSALNNTIAEISYNTSTKLGLVTYTPESTPVSESLTLHIGEARFDALYGFILQLWRAAGTAPPRPPEQIAADNAAQEQAIVDSVAETLAKADPVIKYLVSHTPAECAAYVQANVTSLATAKDMLAKMAMALSVLARRNLR